jgi:addiction module RelE/StbE family toxin
LRIFYASQFKKDFKRTENRLKNKKEFRAELKKIITALQSGKIPTGYVVNKLMAKGSDWFDCYVRRDIVLIYRIHNNCLILSRIGTFTELCIQH